MNPFKAILAIAVSLALTLPVFADEDEDDEREIHRRTNSEVREFFETHFPEPLEHLRHAEEEGDEEGVEQFWHESSKFVGEFFLTREELGPDAAEIFLVLRRTEFVADRLTDEFHHTEDDSAATKIKAHLREVISTHLEHQLKLEQIDRARRELEEVARELEEFAAHRDEIVTDELHERLSGEEEEDDGEEDDDDETEDDRSLSEFQ
jgi:hypothetical protein